MESETTKCHACGKSADNIAEEVTATSSVFSVCVPVFRKCGECRVGMFCSKQCLDGHGCGPKLPRPLVPVDESTKRAQFDERFLEWQKQTRFLHVLLLRLVLGTAEDAMNHSVVLHLEYDSAATPPQCFEPQGLVEKIPDSDVGSVHGGSISKIVSQRTISQSSLQGEALFVPLVIMVHCPREARSVPTVVCGCPHILSKDLFDAPVPPSVNGAPVTEVEVIRLFSKVLK